jgi:prolyl-tRNA editing enzyme YbaK/EbsC (Cys-tRNA(Pro) deacylase)
MAPTLILNCRDGYVAAIIGGDRRIAYKQVKKHLGLKNVSLAGPDQVQAATGAEIGWVSLINPGLKTLVDERLLQTGTACGGCGAPGYSLRIAAIDLVRITGAEVFDFTTPKEKDSYI